MLIVEGGEIVVEIRHGSEELLIRLGGDDEAWRHGEAGGGEGDQVAALAADD